jgi:hypothetical protein
VPKVEPAPQDVDNKIIKDFVKREVFLKKDVFFL